MKLFRAMLLAFTSLVLVACGSDGDDDKKKVMVSINPASATVKVGTTQAFTATVTGHSNTAVTWRVDGTNSGSITSAGVYTAPTTAGTYRVVATSVADTKRSATATVTVTPLDKAMVRVFHASPDAPAVNLWVNDATVKSDLDYQESTGYLSLDEGTYKVAVEGIIPGGNAVVIGPVQLPIAGKTDYDVIAVNNAANIEPLIISDAGSLSDNSKVRVRVAHLTAGAPAVNVYATAPGADLASATALGTFSFKGTLGPVEVPAGEYQLRVTLEDNTLVFDSGTVALAAGKDLLIGAVPNVGTGESPISLAVLDGDDVSVINDVNAGADLRVVHASANAPAVDIFANNGASPVISNLAFPDFTDYLNLPAATYNFKVTPNGATSPVVINADVELENSEAYTLVAVGALPNIEPLVLEDDVRAVATEAKVRLVHASTLAGNVDIYVLPEGSGIGSGAPAFPNVPFKEDTDYVGLKPGTYDVIITRAGMPGMEAIKATLTFEGGKIYTAIARDGAGLTSSLGVIGLDALAD